MKKAQVETIGLVIIVALLAFILVFVLQGLAKPIQDNLNLRYLQLNADNLRSVILKTNVCELSIKDEIINCNNLNEVQCNNLQNCNELNNVIKEIIENSLNTTKNYKFKAGNILVEKGTCRNVISSSSEPIPNNDINVVIEIC